VAPHDQTAKGSAQESSENMKYESIDPQDKRCREERGLDRTSLEDLRSIIMD